MASQFEDNPRPAGKSFGSAERGPLCGVGGSPTGDQKVCRRMREPLSGVTHHYRDRAISGRALRYGKKRLTHATVVPVKQLWSPRGRASHILNLLALKYRFSLFEKSFHSFLLIFGSKQKVKAFPFEIQPVVQGGFKSFEDSLLGQFQGQR